MQKNILIAVLSIAVVVSLATAIPGTGNTQNQDLSSLGRETQAATTPRPEEENSQYSNLLWIDEKETSRFDETVSIDDGAWILELQIPRSSVNVTWHLGSDNQVVVVIELPAQEPSAQEDSYRKPSLPVTTLMR